MKTHNNKVGRPPVLDRKGQFTIRISAALRADLDRLADTNKRKTSDYARLILEEHVVRKTKAYRDKIDANLAAKAHNPGRGAKPAAGATLPAEP